MANFHNIPFKQSSYVDWGKLSAGHALHMYQLQKSFDNKTSSNSPNLSFSNDLKINKQLDNMINDYISSIPHSISEYNSHDILL